MSVVLALRSVRVEDETEAVRAHELLAAERFEFLPAWHESMRWPDYVHWLDRIAGGEGLPAGWVPTTYLVGEVDDQIVGRISLRHTLSPDLLEWGGHIGYAVLPEFRRRGYAKAMVAGVLPTASRLGLSRVLITCDESNAASAAVIEALRGTLEDRRRKPATNVLKRRYWVQTS